MKTHLVSRPTLRLMVTLANLFGVHKELSKVDMSYSVGFVFSEQTLICKVGPYRMKPGVIGVQKT